MATHSPQDLDLLLSKLSGDDSFRQSFLSDPQLALGGLGIKLDASQIPAARSLPSKSDRRQPPRHPRQSGKRRRRRSSCRASVKRSSPADPPGAGLFYGS
jgi:putative modified peptide